MSRKIKNSRGSAILMVLAGIAVVGTTLAVFATYLHTLQQRQFAINYQQGADLVAMNLQATLNNDKAWVKTVNHSAQFNCLISSTDCCPVALQSEGLRQFAIYDESDNLYYDYSNPNSGFDLAGKPCNNFSATNHTADCPLKPTIIWKPINAQAGSTLCHDVQIKIVQSLSPGGPAPLKLDKGDRQPIFLRGADSKSLAAHCAANTGIYSQSSNTCILATTATTIPKPPTGCPPYSYATGDINERCTSNNECPAGQFMVEIDNTGRGRCAAVSDPGLLAGRDCGLRMAVQQVTLGGGGEITCFQNMNRSFDAVPGPPIQVFTTTVAALTARHPGCTSATPSSGACRAASARYCFDQNFGGAGFGPVEISAPAAFVLCLPSTRAVMLPTTFATLTSFQPGCTAATPLSIACASASSRACRSQGYEGGQGPMEYSAPDVVILCFDKLKARHMSDTWAALSGFHPMCNSAAVASTLTTDCNSAVYRYCASKGYTGGAGVEEITATNAEFTCIK